MDIYTICAKYNVDPNDVVYYFKLRNGEPRLILKDDFNALLVNLKNAGLMKAVLEK